MHSLKKFEFHASEISAMTGAELIGEDIQVNSIGRPGQAQEYSMFLCHPEKREELKNINCRCLVFCDKETVTRKKNLTFIVSDRPGLTFSRFVNDFLIIETEYWKEETVSVSSPRYPDVKFGYNVKVGKNTIIAPNTTIGTNCTIGNNVVIRSDVTIGDYCVIRDNTVIGTIGFEFIYSEEGFVKTPPIGGVIIEDNVVIGANCTIEKPSAGFTVIRKNAKIDDIVQIGHSQEIGCNTIITTGFKAASGVKIGDNTFIGMGVTIVKSDITIGDNCLVGAGTIVTKPVKNGKLVYNGNVKMVVKDVDNRIENIFRLSSF